MVEIIIYDASEFRKWLEKNHKKDKKVGVILYKKHTGKKSASHRKLMEEAICFGWIDTTVKKIDEERYKRTFVRRNEKSKWSKNTLGYAKDLLKKGRMSEEGIKYYKLGLSKPVHDHGIPKNPDMPKELDRILRGNVRKDFEKYSPSRKRMLYRWILSGKLAETREKRAKRVVDSVREGKRVF